MPSDHYGSLTYYNNLDLYHGCNIVTNQIAP